MKNYLLALCAFFGVATAAQAQLTMGCPAQMDTTFDALGSISITGLMGFNDVQHTSTASGGYSIVNTEVSGGGFYRICQATYADFPYDAVMQAWLGNFWFVVEASNGNPASNLRDSCQIYITVRDASGPNISPRDISVALNAVSQTVVVMPADVIASGPSDACHNTNLVTTINGQSSVTFNASNLGANTVTIASTDAIGNTNTVTAVVTVTTASSIEQLAPAAWRVYPNPVGEVLFVDLGEASEEDMRLSLRAVDGREVWSAWLPAGTQLTEWQLPASLAKGAYFLHISGKNAKGTVKLMK